MKSKYKRWAIPLDFVLHLLVEVLALPVLLDLNVLESPLPQRVQGLLGYVLDWRLAGNPRKPARVIRDRLFTKPYCGEEKLAPPEVPLHSRVLCCSEAPRIELCLGSLPDWNNRPGNRRNCPCRRPLCGWHSTRWRPCCWRPSSGPCFSCWRPCRWPCRWPSRRGSYFLAPVARPLSPYELALDLALQSGVPVLLVNLFTTVRVGRNYLGAVPALPALLVRLELVQHSPELPVIIKRLDCVGPFLHGLRHHAECIVANCVKD